MAKEVMDKASLYVPDKKLDDRLIERCIALGAKRDRSFNYILIRAMEEYLEREEGKE